MGNIGRYWAIVPAAGIGRRMQSVKPKQYMPLLGKTVLEHTLSRLLQTQIFSAIIVVISETDPYWSILPFAQHKSIIVAPGGKERSDSVLSGLNVIEDKADCNDWILVHDAARPCITEEDIKRLLTELSGDEVGGILALSSPDTLKEVYDYSITKSLNRNQIWRALTPQMFRYGMLKTALEYGQGNFAVTDESSALELMGYKPKIVEGRSDNIKITRPEDLILAQFYMEHQ